MRIETATSLAICVLGASIPLTWVSTQVPIRLGMIAVSIAAVIPFGIVAATAWAVRKDVRASRVTVVVAGLVLGIGIGGWASVPEGDPFTLMLVGLLLVPPVQVLVWIAGALVSGRRDKSSTH
jgi:hypothetical protein